MWKDVWQKNCKKKKGGKKTCKKKEFCAKNLPNVLKNRVLGKKTLIWSKTFLIILIFTSPFYLIRPRKVWDIKSFKFVLLLVCSSKLVKKLKTSNMFWWKKIQRNLETGTTSNRGAKFKTSLRVGFLLDFRNFIFASSAARMKKYL